MYCCMLINIITFVMAIFAAVEKILEEFILMICFSGLGLDKYKRYDPKV